MAKKTELEPLHPKDGGINCVVAERSVIDFADAETKGDATRFTLAQLCRDVGAAVMQLASEQPAGTVEIQLSVDKETDALQGVTTHKWRVDLWKARQRQYLRVPVRQLQPLLSIDTPATPAFDKYPSELGKFHCTHCGQEMRVPSVMHGPLPRKTAAQCTRCTLPIWLQLVKAEPPAP